MKIHCSPLLRKALWLLLAAFLCIAQFAYASELTEAELQTMPTIAVNYQTAADSGVFTLDAVPTLSPLGKTYWAQLPMEAFSFPMTLTITPSETAPYTFMPMSGETLMTDVNTLDYNGTSTMINAYQNDMLVDTYWLYVSTAEVPPAVEPAEVPVYYVDSEDNANVLHYEVILATYGEDNLVTADPSLVPANYQLVGDSTASISVDAMGTATPAWVTFYFQQQVMQGTVQVYYTDAFGNEIASSQTHTFDPGSYTLYPEPADLPAGYVLTADSPTQADITVDDMGNVSQPAVTFFYEQQVVSGTLTVNYADENNVPLVGAETLTLAQGTHTITPNVALIPSGYVLSGMSQSQFEITVDGQGNVSQPSVTFYYAAEQVSPATGTLAVYYMKTDNTQLISPEILTLEQGQHTVAPTAAAIPAGYVLAASSPSEYTVTVGADSVVTPASVTFFYEQPQAVTGTLTIQYVDESNVLLGETTATLSVGTHSITIDPATIPAGYTLSASSPTAFDVTVSESGAVSPSPIAFILVSTQAATDSPPPAVFDPTTASDYTAIGQNAVTNATGVRLRSEPSTASADTILQQVTQGTAVYVYGVFTANGDQWAFVAYGDTDCYVVYSFLDLVIEETPSPEPADTPVPLTLTVQYVNESSVPIADDQLLTLDPGSYLITPDPTHVPEGYTLAASLPAQYTVDVNATTGVSPSVIVFTYTQAAATEAPTEAPPVSLTLTVQYVNESSEPIAADQSVTLNPGSYLVSPDPANVPEGYVLTATSPAQYTVDANETTGVSPAVIVFTYTQAAEATTEPPADTTEPTDTTAPDDTPTPTPTAQHVDISSQYADYLSIETTAVTNDTGVRLRTSPHTYSDNLAFQVPQGTEVYVYGAFSVGDTQWAYIRYSDTDCYVMFSLLDFGEGYATPTPSPTPTPTPSPTPAPPADLASLYPDYTAVGQSAFTNTNAVNLRSEPSASSSVVFQVPTGTEVWVYGLFTANDTEWAYVAYNGTPCYVLRSLIDIDASIVTPTPSPTPSPTPVPTPTVAPADISGLYADYAAVDKPASSNTAAVNLRSDPNSDSSTNIVTQIAQGTEVWLHGTFTKDGREWAYVRYQDTDCYVWRNLLTVDQTYATPTPTPSPSPAPTDTPTPSPTNSPTTAPTNSPTNSPTTAPTTTQTTAGPTETVTDLYVGFAMTNTQVALRDNANFSDDSIIQTLPANTLLYLNGQTAVGSTVWTGAQTYLGDSVIGLLPYDAVRTLTPGEAQVYIDAYNAAHATPTPSPTPTPTPGQQSGYFLTLGDDVPLRNVPGSQSSISAWLAEDQVVYVTQEVYYNGYGWYVSSYGDVSGYIREDQLRPMTATEVTAYLASATPSPTPAVTAAPYDPNADSSYGYVTTNSVNFRQTPNGTRIGVLNQYAFGLVLGSQTVNGTLWYNINQSGTTGWISGTYFNVLSLTELPAFLNSSEYLQGIVNAGSSSSSSSGSSTSGSATQGQVSAVEDWNVGVWENPSSSLNVSYEPFNPYATPTATIAEESPTPEPTATFVIGTMVPITYEEDTKETQSGTGWAGLVLGGIVLVGGAGGVYAYALSQNKKRKAAARASAARQRSQQQAGQQNPYARRAAAAPPTAAGQQKTQSPYQRPNPYAKPPQTPQNPYAQQPTGRTPNPYAQRPAPFSTQQSAQGEPKAPANPYARPQETPAETASTTTPEADTPRTGRRASRHQNRDGDDA